MNDSGPLCFGACGALLDKSGAQFACRIATGTGWSDAVYAHAPCRFADRTLASRSLQRDGCATIRVQFETAIDEGKIQKRPLAAFFFEALKVPAQMMTTFVRHQKIAVCRVTCSFIRADLNAGPAVRLD